MINYRKWSFIPILTIRNKQIWYLFVANRRKTFVKFTITVYNTGNVNGNEVFRMKNYRKRIAEDILKRKMEGKIDTDKMNAPSFLMVLTGTGDYAYRRHDGVYVIPIGCLKN